MKRKSTGTWAALGGLLVLTLAMASPVCADDLSEEKEESISWIDTEAWEDMAAANSSSCVNIRAVASYSSDSIGVLLPGCAVKVLGTEDGWTKIQSDQVTGYVRTQLLVFGEEARVHYKNMYGFDGIITTDVLNVRRDADVTSAQLGQLSEGTAVSVSALEDGWYQTDYQGESAYLSADYVEIQEPTHTALSMEAYTQMLQAEKERKEAEEKAAEAAAAQAAQEAAAASVSSSDLDLLAAIIHCEAGGESRTGKVAVGAVILNRVASPSFPNTITEVVYQSGQFSPAASGLLDQVRAAGADADCYEAAQAALNGENPIGSCLYFNCGYGQGIQIGYQHFY